MSTISKVVNNSMWIILCRIIKVGLAAILAIFTARLLGAADYGVLNYASALISFVSPFVLLGYNATLVKELLTENDDGIVLGTAIMSSVGCSILGMVISVVISYAISPMDNVAIKVTAVYSVTLLFHSTELIQYWFQAKYRSKVVAIVGVIAYAIVSGYKIVLLYYQVGVYWFAFSNAMDYLIISVVLVYIYIKEGNQPLRFSKNKFLQMTSRSYYYAISAFMVNVFTHVDNVMIKSILGNEQIGIYSVAVTCAGMFTFVFVAIIEAMRPYILEGKKINENIFEQRLKILYSVLVYSGMFCGIGITIGAKLIIQLLYGVIYRDSATVLKVLIWNTVLSCIGGAKDIWILAEQKQKYLLSLNAIGVICNIILNVIMIPTFGIIGAAISTVITQFLSNILLSILFKHLRRNMVILLHALNPMELLQIISFIKKRGK